MNVRNYNTAVIIFLVWASINTLSADELPLNPLVNEDTIGDTICVHGWTKTVRPSVNITNHIKRRMMFDIGVPSEGEPDIILDHRIPLSLGGSPDEKTNFILQPTDESHDKDRVELCLSRMVCAGKIKLSAAQNAIWSNWQTAAKLCSGFTVIK
jgi:hypothetical protein